MTASPMDPKSRHLYDLLQNVIGDEGPVYFSPPNKLEYPCILFEIAKYNTTPADDAKYLIQTQYTITVITRDVNSTLPKRVLESLDYISHDKKFVSDRLYHDIFTHYE